MPRHDDTSFPNKDDWQPGDLALCVRGGLLNKPRDAFDRNAANFPKGGAIYVVSEVGAYPFSVPVSNGSEWAENPDLGLIVPDAPPNRDGQHAWLAARFKKIKPPSKDETIEAMKEIVGDMRPKVNPKFVTVPLKKVKS